MSTQSKAEHTANSSVDLSDAAFAAHRLCVNADPLGDGYSKVLTHDLEALQDALGISDDPPDPRTVCKHCGEPIEPTGGKMYLYTHVDPDQQKCIVAAPAEGLDRGKR